MSKCMWKGCRRKMEIMTPLDYPRIHLCFPHFKEHKRLTDKTKCKLKNLRVEHSTFSDLQRRRYLKKEIRG